MHRQRIETIIVGALIGLAAYLATCALRETARIKATATTTTTVTIRAEAGR